MELSLWNIYKEMCTKCVCVWITKSPHFTRLSILYTQMWLKMDLMFIFHFFFFPVKCAIFGFLYSVSHFLPAYIIGIVCVFKLCCFEIRLLLAWHLLVFCRKKTNKSTTGKCTMTTCCMSACLLLVLMRACVRALMFVFNIHFGLSVLLKREIMLNEFINCKVFN